MSRTLTLLILILAGLNLIALCNGCETSTDNGSENSAEQNLDDDDDNNNDHSSADDDDNNTPPAPIDPPEQWGPHGVGYAEFTWIDENRENRSLPVIIFYPAQTPPIDAAEYDRLATESPFHKRMMKSAYLAVKNATPDFQQAPYPIVSFSHGSGARTQEYKYLFEFLASHGYICIAPNHTANVGIFQYWAWRLDMSVLRPLDIIFVLDRLGHLFATPGHPLNGLGDIDRVGQIGHSYGGNTTLALAGATFSYDHITELCADPPVDIYICPIPGARTILENSLPDPRIKAAIALAHDGAQTYFGPDAVGVEKITVPTLVIAGASDNWVPYEQEATPTWKHLNTPAGYLLLEGGGHLGFTDMPNGKPMPFLRMHTLILRYVTAFFGAYVKEEVDYEDFLTAEQAAVWNQGANDFKWSFK